MEKTVENALDILYKLGYDHFEKNDYLKAIIYFERYININPNNANVYNTLGYIYKQVADKYQNLEKQIEYFEKAYSLDSKHVQILRNLALTYPLIGKYQEAVKCFHELFKLECLTDDYEAYAYLKIQLKDFLEGWKYYEYRFLRDNCIEYPKISKPIWNGAKIPNKTLLVHYEQGFGDTLQFCRYIEKVKPFTKDIIFRVQKELFDLIKNNITGVQVVSSAQSLEEIDFDYHIPLLSLMHRLKETVDKIPSTKGYLNADETQIQEYKRKYFNNNFLKIGISWNGRKFGNRYRNIPLDVFYPLVKLKNVQIYSLQKDFGAEQLKDVPEGINIIDLGKTFKDFSDTAAAMSNIDLFITSDNCLLNLAGAMGIPTYGLLNKFSEWRWFLEDGVTPWYDNVTIYKKQDEYEDWNLLIQKVMQKIITDEIIDYQ